ncbi:hypothetical protein GCM10027290_30640 [Micromonospora sonneratiae]
MFDLGEQTGHGDRWVLLTASAEVVAVGIDEGGAVLRCADQTLGFTDTRVAFDGVQPEVEAACALQQSDTLVEQVMDLLPTLFCGGGSLTGLILQRHLWVLSSPVMGLLGLPLPAA